ncbi:YifB family Mg chelatase-like AAA ATPase [Xanthomonas hyacinthi]|uniref:ATP-dependent protease n=1 Tax=Xanthomonas hyacinthi TaxID=56455 RepID=A0A2S7ERK6_9XANT|nr:YifB family Mg chelatase-like AAA ATPase [Xanthomonas hyacinthi]KLD80173.1 ATP-dependent protease [Xanthomonas hyacinthi DSM 19077]PPU95750.1 ATP-dependent protease [Xanthomonas hyacinthi]QGY76655.1 YifB family Mg chelatase-like AAA ATPase [Xanthomonas hyacinthi]
MSLALVHSRARAGVLAPPVRVEVHLSGGLPATQIVGLPEAAVRESRDRVRAAILCAQYEFPARRITVNLAPADLPKEGGRFDLPIALGILAAAGQLDPQALGNYEFLGELALTGELRAVDGVLPAALAAAQAGRTLIVPAGNGPEAALAQHVQAFTARTLLEVCALLNGTKTLPAAEALPAAPTPFPDLSDVRGQAQARRALEIAAAGHHHLLLIGSPGCGKTLLASRLPGILPEASEAEALEAAAIASVSGRGLDPARWRQRPYRSPHHTASAVSLVGGGTHPRPGEISLAHRGVLFLDELPEWNRHALEVLREPLESGQVTVSRAARSVDFPARFQLVAAMNPCPCGWAGDASGRCRCGDDGIRRYRARISGPLLDRIDLHVDVPRLPPQALRADAAPGESSAAVRARVEQARQRQLARAGCPNGQLGHSQTLRDCRLHPRDEALLERAIDHLRLSARSLHRILRVARTIADLDGSDAIATAHLTEAIGYRQLDRGEPAALRSDPSSRRRPSNDSA